MKWIELTVYTTEYGIELVCGALAAVGMEQVSIQESRERIAEHLRIVSPYWDFADVAALAQKEGPSVKVYFPEIPEGRQKLGLARDAVNGILSFCIYEEIAPLHMEERIFNEEDWANNWKQYYKPVKIGSRLLVSPPWEEKGISKADLLDRQLVLIEPGMVFGTGAHHTTRMCLLALEDYIKGGERMLDIGCGSGILSIAALSLGAAHTLCVDIDPVAEKVVKQNMEMNKYTSKSYTVLIGNILEENALIGCTGGAYDIIIANIVAGVVIALCPLVKKLLKPGGIFICSGIIDERESEVQSALNQTGFSIVKRLCSKEEEEETPETAWHAFVSVNG